MLHVNKGKMIGDLRYMKAYKDILTKMSFADFVKVIKAFGEAILFDVKKLPIESDVTMTRSDYLDRLSACAKCSLMVGSKCDPLRSREHKFEKNDDGSPKIINGCGCHLPSKQKSPIHSCPAGEWKVFLK